MARAVLATIAAIGLASSGDLLAFDPATIIAEIILFLLLVALMRVILFRPLVRVLEARDRAIDGARAEAEARVREADARTAEYEERLHDVRARAAGERDALRADGRAMEAALLDRVKAETARAVVEGKAAVRKEAELLRQDLDARVPSLSNAIASRVLGRDPEKPS